jgi:hypothetical protein
MLVSGGGVSYLKLSGEPAMMFRAPDSGPLSSYERVVYGVFLALVLGLFTAEVLVNYQPVKLTALFILLFWILLLVVHEAGHAVVAALLGWHVARVVLGMGRRVGMFHVGRVPVEVRLFLMEGFVQPVPTNLRFPRLKSALIYFAGPGFELLVLAVLVLVIGPAQLLTRTEDIGMLAAQSLAVAILVSAFFNLVPHSVADESGERIPNDGLGIILSFLQPESYFAEQVGERYDEKKDDWESYDSADWWKR